MNFLKSIKDFFVQKFNLIDRWLCRVLSGPYRLWWSRLWIRRDKTHPSLDVDWDYAFHDLFSEEDRDRYFKEVNFRRFVAYKKELKRKGK